MTEDRVKMESDHNYVAYELYFLNRSMQLYTYMTLKK